MSDLPITKFRAWAIDLVYTDGDEVTAYWDEVAGVYCWNVWSVPRRGIREVVIPDNSFQKGGVKSHSEIYLVEIIRTPRIEETVSVEKLVK